MHPSELNYSNKETVIWLDVKARDYRVQSVMFKSLFGPRFCRSLASLSQRLAGTCYLLLISSHSWGRVGQVGLSCNNSTEEKKEQETEIC